MRLVTEAAPQEDRAGLIRDALSSRQVSNRFMGFMTSASSVQQAITEYKTWAVMNLDITFRRKAELALAEKKKDEELFSRIFPRPAAVPSTAQGLLDDLGAPLIGSDGSLKRGISVVVEEEDKSAFIPKRSRTLIPTLRPSATFLGVLL